MKRYRVEYTTIFTKQLQELFDYIVFQYQNPYDALRLVNAIRKKCKGLELFPKGGVAHMSVNDKDFRFIHVGNHTIIYLVDDKGQIVTIWGLFYSRRDIMRQIEENEG